jgi:hypothetical protein
MNSKFVKALSVSLFATFAMFTMPGCIADSPSELDADSDIDDGSDIVDDDGSLDTSADALTTTQTAWLTAHNTRRKALYLANNRSNVPLTWSAKLATSAQNYANKLIKLDGCHIEHGYDGDSYGGENLAATWGSWKEMPAPTPEKVLKGWYDDEQPLAYGQKGHFSQVGWRATKYVGCASAYKFDGVSCHIQVCRYITPGNCNMTASTWKQKMLASTSPCGLQTP